MTLRRQKFTKAAALFLVLSVLHVSVGANMVRQDPQGSGRATTGTATQGDGTSGQLKTRLNRPILVNGVNANAATSITSGAQLQSPAGVGATVLLEPLGQLDIAPDSELTLTFDKGSIDVSLITGCVVLTTNPGINGTVRLQELVERTDRTKRSTIDICSGEPGVSSPRVNQGAAVKAGAGSEKLGAQGAPASKGGISGTTIALVVGAIGGLAGVVAGAAGHGGGGGSSGGVNPSPSAPS